MHVQSDLERNVINSVAALGTSTDPGTVSDAVDLALCKIERDTNQRIDRDSISDNIAAQAMQTATVWLTDAAGAEHHSELTHEQPSALAAALSREQADTADRLDRTRPIKVDEYFEYDVNSGASLGGRVDRALRALRAN